MAKNIIMFLFFFFFLVKRSNSVVNITLSLQMAKTLLKHLKIQNFKSYDIFGPLRTTDVSFIAKLIHILEVVVLKHKHRQILL